MIETPHEDIQFEDEEELEWEYSTEHLLLAEHRSNDGNANVAANH